MKTTSVTLIFAVLAMFFIWHTINNLKHDRIGIRSGIVWIIMWFGIGFFGLFPELLDKVMMLAQMENRMFFILIIAVFILFTVVFNLTSRMDKMERNIARVIQEIAVTNHKIDNADAGVEADDKDI